LPIDFLNELSYNYIIVSRQPYSQVSYAVITIAVAICFD
jgi:hypothetical protein